MDVVMQLHAALSRMVDVDVKQRRTNGFQYIESRRILCGSEHAFRLPVGKSAQDVERYADALVAAVGAPVEVVDRGGGVVVRVIEKDFPTLLRFRTDDLRDDSLIVGYNRLLQPVYHPLNTHLLVGGASRSGKTEWLRWIVYQLCRQRYHVFIADLKGISFFPFETVPGITVYSDLVEARHMLESLVDELERRKQLIKGTRNRGLSDLFQRIAFIGDEGAVFSPNKHSGHLKQIAYECESMIAYLGQQAREFQMFGIMCYQRPDERTINKQYKANVEASIAFRTKDGFNSRIILDRDGAERISPLTPGRCLYSFDRDHVLQTPYIGDDYAWEALLAPLRLEVLERGNSRRAEPPRKYLDGIVSRADSDDKAARDAESVDRSDEACQRHSTGLRTGWSGYVALSRQREGLATYNQRKATHSDYSDAVD